MQAPVEISVIIPYYNHSAFIQDAVQSAVDQEDVLLEIVIVDDGSTDDLKSALASVNFPRLRLIRESHAGAAAARNTGVKESRGSIVAFLDADDRWSTKRLVRAVQALSSTTTPTMSFAKMQEFLDPQLDTVEASPPTVRALQGISASTLVIRREDFTRIGDFDTSLSTGEFIDWYLRATRLGIHTHIDEAVLAYRRIHRANRDRWMRSDNRDYARVLMRNLKERRRG